MAEIKHLASSIETSGDYLPNFRKIALHGKESLYTRRTGLTGELGVERGHLVTSEADAEHVAGLEKFRKILNTQSFDTLLLELAVVHERNWERAEIQSGPLVTTDNMAEQYFTSHIVSYLGRIDEKSLLISAWNKAIETKLLKQADKGRFSIMAYEQTYESSFLAEQFNWAVAEIRRSRLTTRLPVLDEVQNYDLSDEIVDARNEVLGKFKRVHAKLDEVFWQKGPDWQPGGPEMLKQYVAEVQAKDGLHFSPTVYNKTYQFSLIGNDKQRPVENSLSHLVGGVVSGLVSCWAETGERSTAHLKAILDFLMNCCLLVVPFRRPIAFATAAAAQEKDEFAWGDQPGGCLIAIVRPSLGGMVEERQMDDLARRLSLALTRAALRESHVTALVERHKDDVMRVVTHHIPSTIKDFRGAVKTALSHLTRTEADLEKAQQELTFALEESEKLLNQSELSIHAYKVRAGAAKARLPEQVITLAQLSDQIRVKANSRWQRLLNGSNTPPPRTHTAGTSVDLRVPAELTANAHYNPTYLEYVLNELLLNSFKHGDGQTAPSVELSAELGDAVFLIVSNPLKDGANSHGQSKSRLGLTSLENATVAHGFGKLHKPSFSFDKGCYVARIAIAKLNVNGDSK